MKRYFFLGITLSLFLSWSIGCEKHRDARTGPPKPVKDPVQDEIYAFRLKVRPLYNNRRFDELETAVREARTTKKLFGNGSWRIVQFYTALQCRETEPESMWQLHDQIHRDWIAAKPDSITARVAYADFLAEYAWRARGHGFADSVTEEGWRLFDERMTATSKVLAEAHDLKEKDPYLWDVAIGVALAKAWPKDKFDALVAEATGFEPKYWGYDTARANSLLPRWFGKPGDWEAYAEQAAARPNGLGAEAYARIVISLYGYYDDVFDETKASWPKTREGLEQMLKQYPDSLDILNNAALLATIAEDREFAKKMFKRLGNTFLTSVWGEEEHVRRAQEWAESGTR